MTAPTLSTERLLLRPWLPSDRDPFARLNADPRVMEHFPAPLTRAESDALLDRAAARLESDGFGLWAVERRDDGAFIGFAGFARPGFEAHFTPCVEVGWRLAHEAWGRGHATEAAHAALTHGFEVVGLGEIVSFTAATNTRSIRVMERLGMAHDPADDFEHPRLPPGHPLRPHVLYRLTAAAWSRGGEALRRGSLG